MVSNSSSPQSLSRAQEWADRLRGAHERHNIARLGVLAGMVAVAGLLLITLPDSDDDVAAEAFALSASVDGIAGAGDAGAESGALGLGDSETADMVGGSGEAPESTMDFDDLKASAAVGTADAQRTRFAQQATSSLDVSRFSRKTTTTQAPVTTRAPTSAAPTTAAPTTTEAPTTAADETEATAEETTSTGAETTAAESTDPTESTDGTEASESTETTMAGDDEAGAETTETTEEQTTTTAPPTTADNGFVDAGHGVMVPPILIEIRYCESRHNYTAANPYSSARGAYQFLTGSWAAYGHAARYGVSQAHLATPAQQDEAALITWQRDGTRPWNASRHCWG